MSVLTPLSRYICHTLLIATGYCVNPSVAAPIQTTTISAEQVDQLAKQPIWLRLIEAPTGKPEVLSKGFYLSNIQHFKPEAELLETITLLEHQPEKFCDIPARAYWLQEQGILPNIERSCTKIPHPEGNLNWIQVSSFLGNPASTFGHVLIRQSDNDNSENLTDASFNYGAQVPLNENPVSYIFKGLFGGYHGFFATSDYFKQDAAYSKNEQRDMWEYTLDLTPSQKKLINYHLNELQNKEFRYFFIKQNCGFRIASLLELVYQDRVTNRLTPWFAPDSVFQFMADHQTQIPLSKIRYVPSEQKTLYAQYHQLPQHIKTLINKTIKYQQVPDISTLTQAEQIIYLDSMLDYLNYQTHAQHDTVNYPALRKSIVQTRIQLPVGAETVEPDISATIPSTGPRPSRVMLGWSSDDYATAGLTLFSHDPLNTASSLDSTFKAIDLHLNINQQHIRLDHVNLIQIEQLQNMYDKPYGEQHPSWRMNTGYDHPNEQDGRMFIEGAIGAAWSPWAPWLMYGFAGANINTNQSPPIGKLITGFLYKQDNMGLRVQTTYSYDLKHRESNWLSTLTANIALSKNRYLELQTDQHQQQIGLSWHW